MANKWMRKLGMGMSVIMTVSQLSGMVSFAAPGEDDFDDFLETRFQEEAGSEYEEDPCADEESGINEEFEENYDEDEYIEIDLGDAVIQAGGYRAPEKRRIATVGLYNSSSDSYVAAKNTIHEALLNRQESISISAYNITEDEIDLLYTSVLNTDPELFYVERTFRISVTSNGYISKLLPAYDADQYSEADSDVFRAKGREIVAMLDEDWTDLEKVLFLHDYIVQHVEYEKTEPYSKYNAYDALIGKEAVCNGYALAYTYLLSLAGFDSEVVVSDTMCHAWNIVRLDEQYYYVDTTWDDHGNCYARCAYCDHDNFLLNRSDLEKAGHYGSDWYGAKTDRNVYDNVRGGNDYHDFFWNGVNSALPLDGTKTAYCNGGKVHIYDFATMQETASYNYQQAAWPVLDQAGYTWMSEFPCFTILNGVGYYLVPDGIYSMTSDGVTDRVYTITDEEKAAGRMYGLMQENGKLLYEIATSPDTDTVMEGYFSGIVSTKVQSVSLDRESAELETGETVTLVATISPAGAVNKNVSWSSSNEAVATVDADGKVTAVAAGTATITVTTEDGAKTATCAVTVSEPEELHITLNITSISLAVGAKMFVIAEVSPAPETTPVFVYSSGNTAVATVSSDGMVTAIAPGTTTITVQTEDGTLSESVPVTVTGIDVTSVSLDKTELELTEGDNETLVATIRPTGATNKNVSWSSNKESVATVDANGKVTAVKAGTATITVTTEDGSKTASCIVTVVPELMAAPVWINGSSASLKWDAYEGADYYSVCVYVYDKGELIGSKETGTSETTIDVQQEIHDIVGEEEYYEVVVKAQIIAKKTNKTGDKIILVEYEVSDGYAYSLRTSLATPTNLSIASESYVLSFDKVEDADFYYIMIKCENGSHSTTVSNDIEKEDISINLAEDIESLYKACHFNGTTEEFSVSVRAAKNDGTTSEWSEELGGIAFCQEVEELEYPKNLAIDLESYVLSFDKVEDADFYYIMIKCENGSYSTTVSNDTETEDISINLAEGIERLYKSCHFSGTTGEFSISVRAAKNDGTTSEWSDALSGITYCDRIDVTTVSLNKMELELTEGDNETLVATIRPTGATNKNVSWSSNKEAVAKVDANGKVTAVKAGTATITVTTEDGNKTATCTVTVTEAPPVTVDVESVSLNKTNLELTEGENETLTATVSPADATNKNVTWSSNKEAVAKVDTNGKVTAVAAGTATITVTTEDGNKTATCKVTVVEVLPVTVDVATVSLNKTVLELIEGENETLTATVSPADAINKNVTWSSNKESVAKVDANGKVTAVAAGTATITVTTEDGNKTATCKITVVEAPPITVDVESVSLNKTNLELTEGENETLTATVSPTDATNKNVSWSSNKEAVAKVDANGKVTAVAAGTATITVTTEDGNKIASCEVTVVEAQEDIVSVTGVALELETLELKVGESAALTAIVVPENAADKSVIWSSSEEAVASVSENGVVAGVAEGNAIITVTTVDGAFTASCKVVVTTGTVVIPEIRLNQEELQLKEGEKAELTLSVSPEDAEISQVIWSSDNEVVATVKASEDGKTAEITAVKAGTAKIDVVAENGALASCIVEVSETVDYGKAPRAIAEQDGSTVVYVDNKPVSDYTGIAMLGTEENAPWVYMENGKRNQKYTGYVDYDGSKFYVSGGTLNTELNGVMIDPHSDPLVWYFNSNGQVQTQHVGLALYDGEWFYIENGKVATSMNAFVAYNGGLFAVAAGRIVSEYSGLMQDPRDPVTGEWYYFAGGQAQTQYTGLAMYDNVWFYVVKGKLAQDYTGPVDYDGSTFDVVNGMVK